MKWLYLLFRPCRHKWDLLSTQKVFEFEGDTRPCEVKVILRCRKCGDLKVKKL